MASVIKIKAGRYLGLCRFMGSPVHFHGVGGHVGRTMPRRAVSTIGSVDLPLAIAPSILKRAIRIGESEWQPPFRFHTARTPYSSTRIFLDKNIRLEAYSDPP